MASDLFDLSDCRLSPQGTLEMVLALGKVQLRAEGRERAESLTVLLAAAQRAVASVVDEWAAKRGG